MDSTVDPWSGAAPPGPVAHTPNDSGRWHPLREHLADVAELARGFATPFGAGELAYWAGLLHDLGKYQPEFQQYLRECHAAKLAGTEPPPPGSVPHKQAGAAYAAQAVLSALAFPILGHHGQVPSWAEAKAALAGFTPETLRPLVEIAAAECPQLAAPPDLHGLARCLAGDRLQLDLLLRLVYSCLVDADAIDTESHLDPAAAEARRRPEPALEELLRDLRASQEALIAGVEETPVNRIRREIYQAARERAVEYPPGAYRLTVPTGGGKTRTSLAFALEHAVKHGLQRVVYAIPYTSIVEQTAGVFEEMLGPAAVLEHHSAMEPLDDSGDEWARRLASQNWDAPLVVTTTVQLFESLFGNRPGRSRKVHRLTRAVIVLDEVQALPPKLLKPIVDVLRELCDRYGSTVVFCTATQPALDCGSLDLAGFTDLPELAPEPPRLFRELRRVTYDLSPLYGPAWSWARVAEEMRTQPACLAVLNTKKDAHALLEALDDPSALHLSTLLCGRHRKDTLAEIGRRLQAGEPCRVVSTQVVECGSDLDFPLVLRALGPLDRIVQAAGRCNREGRRDPDRSRVVVFRPEDGGMPRGSYAVAFRTAQNQLRHDPDLHDPALYEAYFRRCYSFDDTDARDVQKLRAELDFPAVADAMRLIDEDAVGILVPYAAALPEIEALLQEIRSRRRMSRDLWRRAQPFLVSVTRRDWERFRQRSLVWEEVPDLWRWLGGYDPVKGLTEAERDLADLVV